MTSGLASFLVRVFFFGGGAAAAAPSVLAPPWCAAPGHVFLAAAARLLPFSLLRRKWSRAVRPRASVASILAPLRTRSWRTVGDLAFAATWRGARPSGPRASMSASLAMAARIAGASRLATAARRSVCGLSAEGSTKRRSLHLARTKFARWPASVCGVGLVKHFSRTRASLSKVPFAASFPTALHTDNSRGDSLSRRRDRTLLTWVPRDRWTPEHRRHTTMPKLITHQSGLASAQSAHRGFSASTDARRHVHSSASNAFCSASSVDGEESSCRRLDPRGVDSPPDSLFDDTSAGPPRPLLLCRRRSLDDDDDKAGDDGDDDPSFSPPDENARRSFPWPPWPPPASASLVVVPAVVVVAWAAAWERPEVSCFSTPSCMALIQRLQSSSPWHWSR
mmetsp:Transcript_265/g.988  ORF Transcript_265/g.988 Transcript_265/m.988 type:complete len:393 (+) Transcript_265:494-1672(+)